MLFVHQRRAPPILAVHACGEHVGIGYSASCVCPWPSLLLLHTSPLIRAYPWASHTSIAALVCAPTARGSPEVLSYKLAPCSNRAFVLLPYRSVPQLQQRYNQVVLELDGLADSAKDAAARGDAGRAAHYKRLLWLTGANKMELLQTWKSVRNALAADLDRLRAAAAAYVGSSRNAGAGPGNAGPAGNGGGPRAVAVA